MLHPPNQYEADDKRFPVARRDQGICAGLLFAAQPRRYFDKQVDAWQMEMPTVENALNRLHQTFKTSITPAQSMKRLISRKEAGQSCTEHFLFLVAVSDACGGAASLVLNNIV